MQFEDLKFNVIFEKLEIGLVPPIGKALTLQYLILLSISISVFTKGF